MKYLIKEEDPIILSKFVGGSGQDKSEGFTSSK